MPLGVCSKSRERAFVFRAVSGRVSDFRMSSPAADGGLPAAVAVFPTRRGFGAAALIGRPGRRYAAINCHS